MVLQRGGERSCLKVIALKQGGFASKSGKSLDTQALGIAGDNVTGDAGTTFLKKCNVTGDTGTTFVKMGHVAGCAESSFTQWMMAEAFEERCL